MFELNSRSLRILDDPRLHADLRTVIKHCAASADIPFQFVVTEGLRTVQRQKALVASGASKTMKSRHLTGHAVDLACVVGGVVRWDWPLYSKLAVAVKASAASVSVPIEWGGDWRSFKDGPHFQLPWDVYP